MVAFLETHLRVVPVDDLGEAAAVAATEQRRQAADLATLYGDAVFPPGLLDILNAGLGEWVHIVPSDQLAAYRASPQFAADVRVKLIEILRDHLLAVDEHPTYSRMFTFSELFGKMLLFSLLGIHGAVLRLVTVAPRQENKARLSKVLDLS